MLNQERLQDWIEKYKETFKTEKWWADEKYKWEAITCFQDSWDIEAEDFADMLGEALSKTKNLLASSHVLSRSVINTFAKEYPEEVREMFRRLFDERRNLYDRMDYFKQESEILRQKCDQIEHYQDEHALSIYLWLRYPEKYYIYKISILRSVSKEFESNYTFKNGAFEENINNFIPFYNEISGVLEKDKELKKMLSDRITDECYPDTSLKTLTSDFGYFIDKMLKAKDTPPDGGEIKPSDADRDPYTKENFLKEVFITSDQYDRLKSILQKKKNIILQGAPGVGKTFAAKRLAYSIMGEKAEDRIAFVQFHQNYSYEDFIMGYKPSGDGFELREGIFYKFCKKAEANPDKDYFFIIDEINRGNMSKIFGELLMLIETDYRDDKITLAYDGRAFSVPGRLHIIGMMNTADRSLAMMDYALRRRFSFYDMKPAFDSEGFTEYQEAFENETFDALIDQIKELNEEICQEPSLGNGFCIGHSYFCNMKECTKEWMKDIVDFDILPILSEYWYDDASKVEKWEKKLHGVFQ